MARRASPCTQADIAKLIRAAQDAGYKEHIVGVRLDREGATVLFGGPKPIELPAEAVADKTWDTDGA